MTNSVKKTSDFFAILQSLHLEKLSPSEENINLSLVEEAQLSASTEFSIFSASFKLNELDLIIEKEKDDHVHSVADLRMTKLETDIFVSTLKTTITAILNSLQIDSSSNPNIASSELDESSLISVKFISDNREEKGFFFCNSQNKTCLILN
mgnify:CR=1 FL=1